MITVIQEAKKRIPALNVFTDACLHGKIRYIKEERKSQSKLQSNYCSLLFVNVNHFKFLLTDTCNS